MPRSANGTYTLPIAAFVPGGLIKSSDDNSNLGDIATALTQSLATTGVSMMTGPVVAASGVVNTPSYTFNGATKTGFYLAGANQIGWASNGIQGATLNSDLTTTWAGGMTVTGTVAATKGTIPVGAVADFAGATAPSGWLLCFGQLVSTTTYAALFTQLSTTYGSGAGTFGIPDYRGRTAYGQDNMGGSAANRITVAGGNFDGTVLGGTGGGQNHIIAATEIPAHNHTITDGGHVHATLTQGTAGNLPSAIGIGGNNTGQFTATNTVSGTTGITINNSTGGGNAATVLNPAIITNKIIYAGV